MNVLPPYFPGHKNRYRLLPGILLLAILPIQSVVSWPALLNDIIFSAPAIGPHGEIVFGTKNGNPDFPDGDVYALNPDGSIKWKFTGTDWFESSPAITPDGTVYIGGWDNNLYALKNGARLWQFPTGSAIIAPPTIGPDGTIYIGSSDGLMYAVWPTGQLRWSHEVDDYLSPVFGGAVFNHAGDTIYFGTGDGTLHALDAASGAVKWTYTVPDHHDLMTKPGARSIYSAPAVNSVGEICFSCENGYVYLISPNGILINAFGVSDSVYSSPIIDAADRIYFSSRDTYMYCIEEDTTGILDTVWETYVGDVLYSTPAMDDLGNVVVAGYTGNLVNPTTLKVLDPAGLVDWSFPFPAINDSAPNISPDGNIFFGAYNGYLYKLQGAAPLSFSGWPRQSASRRQTGWSADIRAIDLIDYFPDISMDIQGLSFVPWFGTGWIAEVDLPIIRHMDHGYLYVAESNASGVITWDFRLQTWVCAFDSRKHFYYDLHSGNWLYHAVGTTVDDTRWFFDFSQDTWIPETEMN